MNLGILSATSAIGTALDEGVISPLEGEMAGKPEGGNSLNANSFHLD
ncbi:hypothetical protein C7477_11324 [Phyllobacterium leguminum]|uniref:Uncharacterized protein n=1 Tax=Phyllobacterium leguminum TaxID=314237 RepID=A0A318T3W0_9HYPH|nr:hypothetical protein C7477_11324 [Phyllobacterium leguminum]